MEKGVTKADFSIEMKGGYAPHPDSKIIAFGLNRKFQTSVKRLSCILPMHPMRY
jgi:hypothetical protein